MQFKKEHATVAIAYAVLGLIYTLSPVVILNLDNLVNLGFATVGVGIPIAGTTFALVAAPLTALAFISDDKYRDAFFEVLGIAALTAGITYAIRATFGNAAVQRVSPAMIRTVAPVSLVKVGASLLTFLAGAFTGIIVVGSAIKYRKEIMQGLNNFFANVKAKFNEFRTPASANKPNSANSNEFSPQAQQESAAPQPATMERNEKAAANLLEPTIPTMTIQSDAQMHSTPTLDELSKKDADVQFDPTTGYMIATVDDQATPEQANYRERSGSGFSVGL